MPFKPRAHWKKTIEKNYLYSVSGFSKSPKPVYHYDSQLFRYYSNKLKQFLVDNEYNYNPSNWVFSNEIMWLEGPLSFTRDINVAAWMESSCLIATECYQHKEWNRGTTESIDFDHVDNVYYNWRLYISKEYKTGLFSKYKYYKIKRYNI